MLSRMSSRGQYDSVARVVIFGALAVIVLGLAWKYWYVSAPIVALLVGLFVWLRWRNTRQAEVPVAQAFVIASDTDLFAAAAHLVVTSQSGSAAMLQRELHLDFAEAGELMDKLERAGFVGPRNGSRPRDVLVVQEQLSEFLRREHG